MKVDRSRAVRAELDGRTHYFCSEHCRDQYSGAGTGPVPERTHH